MNVKLGLEKVFPLFKSSKSLLEHMRLLYNKTPTAIIFIYLNLFLFQQVKGVHYSLPYFLGLRVAKNQMLHGAMQSGDLLTNKDGTTSLFQAVVYLSPGDYHRFHSPVEWTINTRRYFFVLKIYISHFPSHPLEHLISNELSCCL